MSATYIINEDAPILVEFSTQPGIKQTSLSPEDAAKRSAEALNNAMGAITQMTRRTWAAIQEVPVSELPSEIEVDFNLKLTSEASVVLAKAALEATFNVKLKWQRQRTEHEQPA